MLLDCNVQWNVKSGHSHRPQRLPRLSVHLVAVVKLVSASCLGASVHYVARDR